MILQISMATDEQTNEQTNRTTSPSRNAPAMRQGD